MLTFKQFIEVLAEDVDNIDEKINNNIQKMGRINLYKIRIRAGKIQRRVKRSAVKGYTVTKKGQLVKMSSLEKMNRKKGARRAKIKRRAHRSQMARHRKISIRKRHALGLS